MAINQCCVEYKYYFNVDHRILLNYLSNIGLCCFCFVVVRWTVISGVWVKLDELFEINQIIFSFFCIYIFIVQFTSFVLPIFRSWLRVIPFALSFFVCVFLFITVNLQWQSRDDLGLLKYLYWLNLSCNYPALVSFDIQIQIYISLLKNIE